MRTSRASSPRRTVRCSCRRSANSSDGELAGGGEVGQLQRGEAARLDAAGVLDLLGTGEERHAADLLEVHAHGVGGRRCRGRRWPTRRGGHDGGRRRSGRGGRRRARGRPRSKSPASRGAAASAASCSSASTDGSGAGRRRREPSNSAASSSRSTSRARSRRARCRSSSRWRAHALDDVGGELDVLEHDDDLVHRERALAPAPDDQELAGRAPGPPTGRRADVASVIPLPRPVTEPGYQLVGGTSRGVGIAQLVDALREPLLLAAGGSGSAATRDDQRGDLVAGPLGEEPDHGVERLGVDLLGGEAGQQVGHAGIGGLDGLRHGGVGHQGAEGHRVEVALEQLLVADPVLDGLPVVQHVAEHLELGAVALVGRRLGRATGGRLARGPRRAPRAGRRRCAARSRARPASPGAASGSTRQRPATSIRYWSRTSSLGCSRITSRRPRPPWPGPRRCRGGRRRARGRRGT